MFIGKLSKIESITNEVSDNPVRTKEIEGDFHVIPTVGESFVIYSQPLDKDQDFRRVVTSIVQEVTKTPTGYTFKTLNTLYSLEVIGILSDQTSNYNS